MKRRDFVRAGSALVLGALGCEGRARQLPADGSLVEERASILRVVPAVRKREGQGAMVSRIFPTEHLRNLDPFVLLDDFDVREPAGFPRHPHRGFEAFTYMLEGAFHHQDTLGNDSVVGAGGTQRFTSGRGAYHSEMPATQGSNRGLQLWVNLPRRLKQMEPSYAPTDGLDIPEADDRGIWTRTVVGPRSPVHLETAVDYLDLTLERKSAFERVVQTGYQAIVYVISGEVRLLGQVLREGQAALPSTGRLDLIALAPSRVLYLAGKAHGEPIVHRGPFVD